MTPETAIRSGALLASTLYFLFVFVAARDDGNGLARALVLGAVGVTFLSYFAQEANHLRESDLGWWTAAILVGLSLVLGFAAGLALLY